jgi:hypothetical protein
VGQYSQKIGPSQRVHASPALTMHGAEAPRMADCNPTTPHRMQAL